MARAPRPRSFKLWVGQPAFHPNPAFLKPQVRLWKRLGKRLIISATFSSVSTAALGRNRSDKEMTAMNYADSQAAKLPSMCCAFADCWTAMPQPMRLHFSPLCEKRCGVSREQRHQGRRCVSRPWHRSQLRDGSHPESAGKFPLLLQKRFVESRSRGSGHHAADDRWIVSRMAAARTPSTA